jgi:hypothetical protein
MMSARRSDPGWKGAYIDTHGALDRPVAIEEALRLAGLDGVYSRVVPDAPGLFTRLQVHLEALRGGSAEQWLHVVEDAALLSRSLPAIMGRLIASGALENHDLVFTDVTLTLPHVVTLRNLKRAYDKAMAQPSEIDIAVMDLSEESFGGGNSYFVNPRSVAKVQSALAARIAKDARTPADFFGQEVREGRLRAACTFPYLSAARLDPGDPDIATSLLRTMFFLDWNAAVLESALAVLPPAIEDPRLDTIADVVGIMVAD